MTEPCNRCGTEKGNLRLAKKCVWCYAVTRDRPDDADAPEVVERGE